MTATLLPIPDDPRLQQLRDDWLSGEYERVALKYRLAPRSRWLKAFEELLREFYPQANSDSLTLTARHSAPFPLAAGKDVP